MGERETYHIGTTLKKEEWVKALSDESITRPNNIDILQTMYSFEGHKAAASQIGLILGYTGKNPASPLNAIVGNWGKRLVKKFPYTFSKREDGTERKWDLFFDGWSEKRLFIWKLKDELKEALEELNLTGEQHFAEEIPSSVKEILFEGAKKTITVNAYERNSRARYLCIKHYGTHCQVCNFDFEKTYGDIGKDFIHVHHLTKVSDIKEKYEVNPIEDLIPVCPNCHAMLHRQEPPFTVEELKKILQNSKHSK
ncbi:HNH endonuclease [Riemerella anatipestifer]|uniref:HNH endonuclease n=1 Tax=Riemerella anatipestifer TaxID=34085 RepID=UPI0009BAE342|nr:HNH endonuclease [Riemerella anatipestifer]MDY3530176.1 HNH endonuclease [Riemerella anatipestifer]